MLMKSINHRQSRTERAVHTYRADDEDEKDGEDVDGHIVRTLLSCAAASWFAVVILSPLQFGVQEFYGDMTEVVVRGHFIARSDALKDSCRCLLVPPSSP